MLREEPGREEAGGDSVRTPLMALVTWAGAGAVILRRAKWRLMLTSAEFSAGEASEWRASGWSDQIDGPSQLEAMLESKIDWLGGEPRQRPIRAIYICSSESHPFDQPSASPMTFNQLSFSRVIPIRCHLSACTAFSSSISVSSPNALQLTNPPPVIDWRRPSQHLPLACGCQ